jgi:diadenosine tetraphosphate (Ap4A) HIT family hydrolase
MPMLYRDFLKELHTCPFCSPKDRVLVETEHAYLTYALAPYHPHHMLVIPKRHLLHFLELAKEEQNEIDTLIKDGFAALRHLGYQNITALVREGSEVGKSIAHLHYHLIPNVRIGDIDHEGRERAILTPEEIESTVSDIIPNLNNL